MAWNDPLTSDSKEPFCACVVFSLILYSDRILPLFVHAKIITWMFTRDKDWLLTLFLLLLQFPRANRGLVVNSSTGTHLCCLRKCREEAGCEFSTWNPSISHLTGSLNSENKNEIRIFLNTIYKNKLQIR